MKTIKELNDLEELIDKSEKDDTPYIIDKAGTHAKTPPWFIQVKPEGKLPYQITK